MRVCGYKLHWLLWSFAVKMRDLCHVLMGEIWFYLQLLRILLKVQSISCSGAINEKPFNTKIRRKIGWFIDTSPKDVTNVMIYANYKMRFFGQLNSISKICLMDHSIRVPFYFGKVFVYFMPVSIMKRHTFHIWGNKNGFKIWFNWAFSYVCWLYAENLRQKQKPNGTKHHKRWFM